MINFLLLIDYSGSILDIKWSSPAYIIPSHTTNIFAIFAADSHEMLRQNISESLDSGSLLHCSKEAFLNREGTSVRMCIQPADKNLLVFAAESSLAENYGSEASPFQHIIHSFMSIIREYTREITLQKQEASRIHFEKLQALNNELINTRRNLEKANARLNQLNQQLNNRLVRDALTGLVSRYQYRSEIDRLIASDQGKKGIFTFIDIDHFKSINDNYGHAAGDAYLVEFAQRLQDIPLDETIKMRISGDEFGLFTYGYDSAGSNEVEHIWQQIRKYVLNKPVQINQLQLDLNVSAGMSIYGKDTTDVYDLIEYADFAMYKAKQAGRNGYSRFCLGEYTNRKSPD